MSSLGKHYFQEPFLSLQRYAIIRSLKHPSYAEEKAKKPLLYKKPAEICKDTDEALPVIWKNTFSFSQEWRKKIASYMHTYKVSIKKIEDVDTPAIKEFLTRRYSPEMAAEICAFDLFRIRQYGHGLILKDAYGKVQGTVFEVAYATEEKTSYTLRLAIADELKGKNLGLHLMQYSCLLAMEQGSRIKRGIIQFDNLPSLYINLNKVGWICDRFEPHINGLGAFFHIALPLDLPGLTRNTMDMDRMGAYIKNHQIDVAYKLLDCRDIRGISEMYRETDFKIIAVLKAGIVSKDACFLAIPSYDLQLEYWM